MGLYKELEAAKRKRLVSSLLLWEPSLTTREIAAKLEAETDLEKHSVNPNGSAWSHATIASDIMEVRAAWKQEAVRDLGEVRAELIAKYREMLSETWKQRDWNAVAAALKGLREVALLTDAQQVYVYQRLQSELDKVFDRLERAFGAQSDTYGKILEAIKDDDDEPQFN